MVITLDTFPANAAASAVALEQKATPRGIGGLLIPHRVALLGQYNAGKTPTANVPQLVLSADEAATLYGRGSMLHLMAKRHFAQAPVTPCYCIPLADHGSGVAATGTIVAAGTATAAGTIAIFIAGQKVSVAVAKDDTAAAVATKIKAAIDAVLDLPVSASVNTATVTLTSRWKGATANDIRIQRDLDTGDAATEPAGITLTLNAMASGAQNPDPTTALGLLGAIWFTAIACPYQDSVAIAAIEAAAETRSGAGVKRPFLAVFGYTGTRANFTTAVTARNSKFACWLPAEDSPALPLEIAACGAALYGARQSSKPGAPMRGVKLVGIRAGQAAQWTYAEQDAVVKAGGSTTRNSEDGTVITIDLATTNKTNDQGVADESYRFAAWLGNWQTKLYSLDTLLGSEPFVDATVVDDEATTGVEYAISPKVVKAAIIQLVDSLWVAYALTKERDSVVKGIVCEISATNPGRIDLMIPDTFSAGLRIIAGKVAFGFYAPSSAA